LRYEQRGGGIRGIKLLKGGSSTRWEVANFTARIVRDIILDDGEDQERKFGVEVQVGGKTLSLVLSVTEFRRMNWVLYKIGPEAVVYPGQQQHARAAIQSLSGPIQQERVFSHLGWREFGNQWVYLHAGGAIGAAGGVSGVEVRLPAALRSFQLQPA